MPKERAVNFLKRTNEQQKKRIVYIVDDVLLICEDCITDKERSRLRKEHALVAEDAKAYEDNFCQILC